MADCLYTTPSKVRDVAPDILITDNVTDELIQKAINSSGIKINTQLKHLYDTPLVEPYPDEVVEACNNYACYYLLLRNFQTQNIGEEARKIREEFEKQGNSFIKNLIDGKYRESEQNKAKLENSRSYRVDDYTDDDPVFQMMDSFIERVSKPRFL